MKQTMLRDKAIFWSRLGMFPNPTIFDEEGLPVLLDDTFSQLKYHQDFYQKGVKIHSFILHSGWVGDGRYDFTITDRTMDVACQIGEDALLIPRIKFDPPVEWMKNHPEELLVYYDGPRDAEEIRALVDTPQHDFLGYEAPDGLYMGNPKYARPNVGGLISNQSFSSDLWLRDAKEAMGKLLAHLEEKYGDRILGYHIAYGTSGETLMWGRISQKYGDYGITNQKKFKAFLKERYGLEEELGTPMERYKQAETLEQFMRADNPVARYYDEFTDEVNSYAVEYLCKAVKEFAPDKLTGVFYGYFMGIAESGYTGHTQIQRLLDSPYVDFFSAPKTYYRVQAGDSGGEYSVTQSINHKKIWVDECDVRTHLAKVDSVKNQGSDTMQTTKNALYRELGKNLSHNSGFWFMDLGGGWYDSPEMMDLVEELNELNETIRKKEHKSISDVLVVIDEKSTSVTSISFKNLCYRVDIIADLKRSGALVDIYRQSDLKELDLSQYNMIVFACNYFLTKEEVDYVVSHSKATVMFQYAAGCLAEGYSLENTKNTTGFSLYELPDSPYDFPCLKAEGTPLFESETGNMVTEEREGRRFVINTCLKLPIPVLNQLVKQSGCHIYCEEDYVLYGDDRFLCVTANDKFYEGEIDFGKERNWYCVNTKEKGIGKKAAVQAEPYDVLMFLFD